MAERLSCGQRPDAKCPAVAGAIIAGEFTLDQGGIAPDCGEVRLSALDRFLSPCRGIDG